MRRVVFPLAFAFTSAVAGAAGAHIRLDSPAARYSYTGDGQKTGPCGEGNPSGQVTWFMPGETITVEWTETINHPGHFRISLDPDGGEDDLVDPTDYDDFNVAPSVLLDNIADNGGSTFSAQVTLPDTECELCSLQLIQVMTDKPPWGPAGGNDIYYWCADIRISATPPMTTSASAGGTTGSGAGVTSGSASTGSSSGSGGSGGDGEDSGEEDGCGCVVAGDPARPWAPVGALGLASLLRLRRRFRP